MSENRAGQSRYGKCCADWNFVLSSQILPNGSLGRDGNSTLLVTEDSACRLGLASDSHRAQPMETDHRQLVRFEHKTDSNYLNVKVEISGLVARARQSIRARFVEEKGG